MARPTRQGVDYFPLDIHLDDKFKFIEIKFGLKGFAVIIKLLQKIYSYGYWYGWEDDEKLIFAHENNIDADLLENIISESLKRDIFNKSMYERHNILTSTGIQKRYQEIVKRRKNVEIVEEYLLIDGEFGYKEDNKSTKSKHNANTMHTSCKHNADRSTQSKVKESKVKESKSNKINIDEHFEKMWSLYPLKRGKGQISDTKKNEIFEVGEEFERCIDRYLKDVKERKKTFRDLKYQNGSTFFNTGYVDFLDKNVKAKTDKKNIVPFKPNFIYREL